MGEIIKFQTTDKEDIFDLGRGMGKNIPRALLKNAATPIFILVNGDHRCGKSIIADALRGALFTGAARMSGAKASAQHWNGMCGGQMLQFNFFNGNHGTYNMREMISKRSYGGVIVINNLTRKELESIYRAPAIEMNIEYFYPPELKGAYMNFNEKASGGPWNRDISMEIVDDALLEEPLFVEFLNSIRQKKESGIYSVPTPEMP